MTTETVANDIGEGEDLDSLVSSVADQLASESGDEVPETDGVEEAADELLAKAEGEDEPAVEEPEAEPERASEEASDEDDSLVAPEHWPQEIQEAFNRADRTAQEAWLEQQRQFQRGYNDQSQRLKEVETEQQRFQETAHVLSKYEPFWHAQGMSTAQGVNQLATWAMALAKDPVNTIPALAKMYGVDMMELAQGQPYVAPEDSARDQRMQQLEQRLALQDQREAEMRQNQLVGQIEAFRDQTDADGNLAYPHFNEVVDSMIGMYQRGFDGPLEQAYEQAVWTNPEIRQQLINGVKTETTQQASLQRVDDAKRAKQASQQRVRKSQPKRGTDDFDGMNDDELIAHLARRQAS